MVKILFMERLIAAPELSAGRGIAIFALFAFGKYFERGGGWQMFSVEIS